MAKNNSAKKDEDKKEDTQPASDAPVENEEQVWKIKSADDQPFVRLGILFDANWQEVDVSKFSEEDKQILLDEPALEIQQ